jgi:tetratricopeptide (TPR) repeat protein
MDPTQIALGGFALALVAAILLFKPRRSTHRGAEHADLVTSPGGALLPHDKQDKTASQHKHDKQSALPPNQSEGKVTPRGIGKVRGVSGGKDLTLPAKTEEKLVRLLKAGGFKPKPDGGPGQLPSPESWFIGRRHELARLLAQLDSSADPDEPRAVVITAALGAAGVGRTALALAFTHLIAERFPDGQLYFDLGGYAPDDVALTASDALRHAVQSLQLEALPPADLKQLAACYRRLLEGKRILILVENAHSDPQLNLLLPPEGSVLVLTSPNDLRLENLEPVALEPFTRPDARAFLRAATRKLASESDKRLDSLAEASGYLAEALRLNAGRLQSGRSLASDKLCAALKKAGAPAQPLDAAIRVSFAELPPDLLYVWRRVAIFPSSFDGKAATNVCESNKEMTTQRLDALSAAGLLRIEHCQGARRFEFHGVARPFARQLLDAAEGEADGAGLRFATHFCSSLASFDKDFAAGNEGAQAALRRFDRERTNIDGAWYWAHRYVQRHQPELESEFTLSDLPAPFIDPDKIESPSYAAALQLLAGFPKAGARILALRQHPSESERWWKSAVSSARALGDRPGEGDALKGLGRIWMAGGNSRRAIDCFEESLEIAREAWNRPAEAEALGDLGLAWMETGCPDSGTGCFEAQLQIVRELGDRSYEVRALAALAQAHAELGELQTAADLHEQQLQIARELGVAADVARALENLGHIWVRLGDGPKAAGLFEEQLKIAREIHDRATEGRAFGNLGLVSMRLGEVTKALDYYCSQLQITRELADRIGESQVLGHLGVVFVRLGEVRKSVESYSEQCTIAQELDNSVIEATALSNVGVGLERLGDLAGAAVSWERALPIYEALESPSADTMRRWLERARKESSGTSVAA